MLFKIETSKFLVLKLVWEHTKFKKYFILKKLHICRHMKKPILNKKKYLKTGLIKKLYSF